MLEEQVREIVAKTCPAANYAGKSVLLIVPDGTRTAPVGLLFKTIHRQIAAATRNLDVMIALGTHQINLGYRHPKTVRMEDYANREHEDVLLVPKAGEMLYHLKNPPAWARA